MEIMPKHLKEALEGLKKHCDEVTFKTLKVISSEKDTRTKVFLAGMLDYLSISRKAIDAVKEYRKSLCEGCGEIAEVRNSSGKILCFSCALRQIEEREERVRAREDILREYQVVNPSANRNAN